MARATKRENIRSPPSFFLSHFMKETGEPENGYLPLPPHPRGRLMVSPFKKASLLLISFFFFFCTRQQTLLIVMMRYTKQHTQQLTVSEPYGNFYFYNNKKKKKKIEQCHVSWLASNWAQLFLLKK